jgi:hypothetical protein
MWSACDCSGDKIKENPDIVQSPEAYLSLVTRFMQPNSSAPINAFLRTMDSNFLSVFLKHPNVSTYYLDVPRWVGIVLLIRGGGGWGGGWGASMDVQCPWCVHHSEQAEHTG